METEGRAREVLERDSRALQGTTISRTYAVPEAVCFDVYCARWGVTADLYQITGFARIIARKHLKKVQLENK
jgi:hypothetical protein